MGLQEKIVLLQGELEQVRSDNEEISQELVAGTPATNPISMETDVRFQSTWEGRCVWWPHARPPDTPCLAAPIEPHLLPQPLRVPVFLPSPPLKKRDLPVRDGWFPSFPRLIA